MFEENLIRVMDAQQPQFTKQEFSGGLVVFQEVPIEILPPHLKEKQSHKAILNTYYTEDGFSDLADECGFKIEHAMKVHNSDNDRVVVLLKAV